MLEFLLCLLGGMFGLHKFYRKEYKKGFLYLFTLGLFGIGWMVDTVRLGVALSGSGNDNIQIINIETDIDYDEELYYDALVIKIIYKKPSFISNATFQKKVEEKARKLFQENSIEKPELEWINDKYIESRLYYILHEE